jgi:transglutaminase-like putative cysteine protease
VPNLFDIQSIVLKDKIPNPHGQSAVVYRVTLTGPAKDISDIEKTFATGDGRQEIKNLKGNTFELHIKAVRAPKSAPRKDVPDEFTTSNFFITSADGLVQQHAREAVGKESDPWKKALLIEKWVRANMRMLNFDNGMAPADWVAKNLAGDCTEFAMLAAAMCRAEGVPSRTDLGLVYHLDRDGKTPKLSYHMWMEVNVNGQWIALDPTLAMGSVGPGHIKICDHSWHETRSMVPLLPVMRVMTGKPKIEVIKIGE